MASVEHGRVPSPRPIASKEVPLVDRTEEMNVLKEAVYRAVHGEGGLVFVHGEAGIGKTRLLRELGTYAWSRGLQVLYGRCPALFRTDSVPPYVLWKEVIKDYLESCTLDQLDKVIGSYPAEVAKLVPEFSQKLRWIPPSLQISPEQEQNRLFEAVSQFITNVSRDTPLIVVLDDLQWTDPSSLLLLHYLARGVQKMPLLLLGAYRSTDIDDKHPLSPVLTDLNRERLPQFVSLKRMSLSDVSEMIKNILEQKDVPEEFCELIYEKTRGNPFFAEEVIRSLKEEGVIYREENKWKTKEVTKIEFPETVRNVIRARIGRLDDGQQNVLTMASLLGNDFTFEALEGVTGLNEDKLRKIVDGLLKAGLFKHRDAHGKDVCSFADIIMRNVVYAEVGTYERKKLHGVVGTALEKIYAAKIDEHLGELASHFLESGDRDKALNYFLRAGEKARGIYASAEAASYFQSALGLLEEKEGELQEKGRVLERLGDIKGLVGEHDACLKYWNDAILLREQLEEKEDISRLYRKIARVLWENVGDVEKAKENYDKALKILEGEPEKVELASLYEDMAHMCYRVANTAGAFCWAERALELAKKLDAQEVMASSYASLGTIFGYTGDLEKGRQCHGRALKIALDKGYMETAYRAYQNLAVALHLEEYEKRLEYLEKAYELAKKAGAIGDQSWSGNSLGVAYSRMGNMAKAMVLFEESVALDTKAGNLPNLAYSEGALGYGLFLVGDWDKGERCVQEALSFAQKSGQWQMEVANCYRLGRIYLNKEKYDKAAEFVEKASSVCEKVGSIVDKMQAYSLLIQIYAELGKIKKAENLLGDFRRSALESKNKGNMATADALGGMLLRAQKRWKESIELFEKSLQEFEALNARRWDVYDFARILLYEYARVYLERNEEGDREKARDLLNQALEICQKIGAKKDIEKVEARLAFIETGKVAMKSIPIEHVSTGFADLDKLLYGGIPQSYAVVLTSPSCDERDFLIRSFLETGAKKGEVTFYVTTDPNVAKSLAEEFQSNFLLFVCNPEADAIIKGSPSVHTLKGVENLTDISIALTSAIRRLDPTLKGPRRICLGLVSDVLLQHHAVETRRWLTALVTKLKSENFTTLAVIDIKMHPSEELYAILGLFEGEISIYEKETEKGLEKLLKIKKMSNQKYLKDELPLGLALDS